MTDIIQLLPDHVANQIAAGEVVQRPASVVKELLENAIDAKAKTIKLIVKDGGKTLIQVVDNGTGMTATDARLSFERHATSKIKSAEDLFNLHTKGFRGEALASIAAIAHVDMHTKTEVEEVGSNLKIEGSKVVSQEIAVTPKGTSIAVKNLFYNIPARRNFLKSDQVELRHITDEFHRVALVHPDISFKYFHNGSELFNLPASSFRQRIVHIFGKKMNERLVPVTEQTEVLHIDGFVVKPEFAKKSRGEQFFFANDRFIKSPYLHHAVAAAFEGLMKPNLQPGYFLKLKVDPKSIDINIHPTKTEVKFDDEHTLYALLRSAIKHALGQFNIAPVLDFERDSNLDTPYQFRQKEVVIPKVAVDPNFNPFAGGNSKQSAKGWQDLYDVTATKKDNFSSVQFESETINATIFTDDKNGFDTEGFTFQLRNKFIVTKSKSALVIINQNRAHQRILYERFLKEISSGNPVSQELLFPSSVKLTATEFAILARLNNELKSIGFEMQLNENEKNATVTAVPSILSSLNVGTVLENLVRNYEVESEDDMLDGVDFTAKQLAKSMAIQNGVTLEPQAQMAVVNDLYGCVEPELSPFNKRTFITLSDKELENKF